MKNYIRLLGGLILATTALAQTEITEVTIIEPYVLKLKEGEAQLAAGTKLKFVNANKSEVFVTFAGGTYRIPLKYTDMDSKAAEFAVGLQNKESRDKLKKELSDQINLLTSAYGKRLNFFIVQKLATPPKYKNLEAYEILVQYEVPYMKHDLETGLPLPVNTSAYLSYTMSSGFGRQPERALLITTKTSFQTKGNATLLVKIEGPIDLVDKDGFPLKVPAVTERSPDPAIENAIIELYGKLSAVIKRDSINN